MGTARGVSFILASLIFQQSTSHTPVVPLWRGDVHPLACVIRASIHSRNCSTIPSTLHFTSESQNRIIVNPNDSSFSCLIRSAYSLPSWESPSISRINFNHLAPKLSLGVPLLKAPLSSLLRSRASITSVPNKMLGTR